MADTTQSTELFGQAARSFEAAIQSGLRLQEESVKFVTEMINEMGFPEKWQQRTQAVIHEMINTSQKNMDEAMQMMNENTKTGLELLQKAFQAPATEPAAAQSQSMSLWETALTSLRRNTEAMLRANTRLVEAWTEMAKKFNGEQWEQMAQMSQRAQQAGQRAAREATAAVQATVS